MKKMNQTSDKAKIIYSTETTIALFCPPIIITLILIYHAYNGYLNFDFVIYFLLLIASILYWYLLSYKKELILTEHKLYITKGKNKVMSLSLIKDLDSVSYSQKGMGKKLSYGTLTILSKSGKSYIYSFISNPKITYEQIIYAMETKYINMNPDFTRSITLEDTVDVIERDSNIDKI